MIDNVEPVTVEPVHVEDISAVQVKRKRTTKPLPLEEKLFELKDISKPVAPLQKGFEGRYLNALLLQYQAWFKQSLEAKGSFDEIAYKIERLGHTRPVRVSLIKNY